MHFKDFLNLKYAMSQKLFQPFSLTFQADDKNHKQADEIKVFSFSSSSLLIIKINSIFYLRFGRKDDEKRRKDVAHTIKQQRIFTQASKGLIKIEKWFRRIFIISKEEVFVWF